MYSYCQNKKQKALSSCLFFTVFCPNSNFMNKSFEVLLLMVFSTSSLNSDF